MFADRPGLSDPKMVEELQEKVIEAIKLQLSRSHSSNPQVFPNLLMKLSELRTVGKRRSPREKKLCVRRAEDPILENIKEVERSIM